MQSNTSNESLEVALSIELLPSAAEFVVELRDECLHERMALVRDASANASLHPLAELEEFL